MPPTPEEIAAAEAEAEAAANANNDDDEDDDIEPEVLNDAERMQAALRASRKAERNVKRQSAAIARERDELKRGQLSDAERIQAERDEAIRERDDLKLQVRDRDARSVVENAARGMNAIHPDVVYKLVSLEYDDNGKPINVRSELNELKKNYPSLFGAAGSADGVSGRGQAPGARASFSDQIRQAAGRG